DENAPQESASLQGMAIDASDTEVLCRAIDLAFDYRGDVTVVRKSTREPVAGYIFDRAVGEQSGISKIRLIPADGRPRVTIPYDDIAEVRFSGRDPAAGKSFETWMKQYVRKKLSGEAANIESEPLEGGDSRTG
ncbi:MAG: hypothetical protein ACYSTY_08350, partial [Planctomycetota bacterium]